jgi:hypothetical protein
MSAQELALNTEATTLLADMSAGDIMLNVPLLQQIDNMAARMASAKATIPKHLVGNDGDCWAIIMQAIQWRMNPYAVAQKTHLVNGTLGYEAQLVNAVIQNSGLVTSPFRYEYRGEGQELECRVGAVLKGDSVITWGEWLCIASVKVKNSPLWATNPKQQMSYLQGKNWARLYCPGAILGVYTPDELQEITPTAEREIGPKVSDLNEAIKKRADVVQAEDAVIVEDDPKPADTKPAPEPDQSEDEAEQLPLAAEHTFATVSEALNAANSPETLQAAVELMAEFIGIEGNEQYKKELSDLYRHRLSKLKGK